MNRTLKGNMTNTLPVLASSRTIATRTEAPQLDLTGLSADEGLVIGWCLFHRVSPRATWHPNWKNSNEYAVCISDVEEITQWCPIFDANGNILPYDTYCQKVRSALGYDTRYNRHFIQNSTSITDMMGRAQMVRAWARLAEIFLIITPDESSSFQQAGGTGPGAPQSHRRHFEPRKNPLWA